MFWPASEQYTWFEDARVISVLKVRTPHTFNTIQMAESTIWFGLTFNLDDARLSQSLEQINIRSESFHLELIESESTHKYGDEEYSIVRENVLIDGLDVAVAEILIVAIPSAGGELTILSITRLKTSIDDVWEESLVLEWLAFSHEIR